MDCRQRRRARGVHRDARPTDSQEVRQPSGSCGEAGPRPVVEVDGRRVAGHQLLVIRRVEPDEHASAAIQQLVGDDAGVFQRLPRNLEEDPLLRVETASLASRDAEERGVEAIHVVEQTHPRGDVLGHAVPSRAPSPILGELAHSLSARPQKLPERSAVGSPGEAASDPHDRDGVRLHRPSARRALSQLVAPARRSVSRVMDRRGDGRNTD